VRTTAAECRELGRRLAERAAAGAGAGNSGRPVVLLPSGGLSAIDAPGQPLHDPDADAALLETIRATARPDSLRLVEVEGNLDRPEVGTLAADLLAENLVGGRPVARPRTTQPARLPRPGAASCTQ
jgi:uncharacterized protein (UPF0261 family)